MYFIIQLMKLKILFKSTDCTVIIIVGSSDRWVTFSYGKEERKSFLAGSFITAFKPSTYSKQYDERAATIKL